MANGFFLGGVAEGMRGRDELDLKTRALDIKEDELAGNQQRQLATELEKTIAGNVQTITGIIQESRKAGASPAQIRATIAPLVQSFQQLAQRTGRDITTPMQQFDALINIPAGAEAEPTPSTEIGKTRQDVKRGFITPEEGTARIERLTRGENPINVVENIRRKIASGEALTPGEKQVYDDVLRGDLTMQILRASGMNLGNLGIGNSGTTGIPTLPPGPR